MHRNGTHAGLHSRKQHEIIIRAPAKLRGSLFYVQESRFDVVANLMFRTITHPGDRQAQCIKQYKEYGSHLLVQPHSMYIWLNNSASRGNREVIDVVSGIHAQSARGECVPDGARVRAGIAVHISLDYRVACVDD